MDCVATSHLIFDTFREMISIDCRCVEAILQLRQKELWKKYKRVEKRLHFSFGTSWDLACSFIGLFKLSGNANIIIIPIWWVKCARITPMLVITIRSN